MPGIVLIGYRAAGKTTVGRMLAERAKCGFVDTDKEIERRTGMAVSEFFTRRGEPAFRSMETTLLNELANRNDFFVLATGGGIPVLEENRKILRQIATPPRGKVVWLAISPETALLRMRADPGNSTTRPALTPLPPDAEARRLVCEREPFYRTVADLVIQVDPLDPEAIADAILRDTR